MLLPLPLPLPHQWHCQEERRWAAEDRRRRSRARAGAVADHGRTDRTVFYVKSMETCSEEINHSNSLHLCRPCYIHTRGKGVLDKPLVSAMHHSISITITITMRSVENSHKSKHYPPFNHNPTSRARENQHSTRSHTAGRT